VDEQFFPPLLRLFMVFFYFGAREAKEGMSRTNLLGMVPDTATADKSRNRGSCAACPVASVIRCAARICEVQVTVGARAEVLSLGGREMLAGPS
jgi:hypothetical protein